MWCAACRAHPQLSIHLEWIAGITNLKCFKIAKSQKCGTHAVLLALWRSGGRVWHVTHTLPMEQRKALRVHFRHGGRSWSGPGPKGGGGGALRTPKLSHGTVCFVGARGAGHFVLGIRHGEFFSFDPMCLCSKYSECRGEFKNG